MPMQFDDHTGGVNRYTVVVVVIVVVQYNEFKATRATRRINIIITPTLCFADITMHHLSHRVFF